MSNKDMLIKKQQTEIIRLREVLVSDREYFDQKADADCDQDGYIPNTEMMHLVDIDQVLAK